MVLMVDLVKVALLSADRRDKGVCDVGAEAIYDRHSYNPEKADALKRLANLVQTSSTRRRRTWFRSGW
jgi:hypothetical protein